jgi:hypothetical protein
MSTELLGRIAAVAERHTATPGAVFAGIWEGWGGLNGSPAGPRLQLPGRDYLLFRADVREFATDAWTTTAPWADPDRISVQTPNVLWPQDRAWFVATEVDFNSTIVGGTEALIAELLATDGVEAARVALTDDLSSEGDALNR